MKIIRHMLLAAIIATVIAWAVAQRWTLVYYGLTWSVGVFSSHVVLVHGTQTNVYVAQYGGTAFVSDTTHWSIVALPVVESGRLLAPFWLIVAILLIPWWLMRRGSRHRQRKRWAKEGRCLTCGYNLQGSESGTCSECGAGYGDDTA